MNWWKRFRVFVLYPVLFVAGCHTLGTGSPIPLWHIESLNNPVPVRSVTRTHLLLEDGRSIALPLIKELPQLNPLFLTAIANGVEVGPTGQVDGLIWIDRLCGNDPVVWRRIRVDLSILAAALNPAGLDVSLVPPEVIEDLHEHFRIDFTMQSRSHRIGHLSGWDAIHMRWIRRRLYPDPTY